MDVVKDFDARKGLVIFLFMLGALTVYKRGDVSYVLEPQVKAVSETVETKLNVRVADALSDVSLCDGGDLG